MSGKRAVLLLLGLFIALSYLNHLCCRFHRRVPYRDD